MPQKNKWAVSWFGEEIKADESSIEMNTHDYEQLSALCLVLKSAVFHVEKASSKVLADLQYVSMHEASLAFPLTNSNYLEPTYQKQAPQETDQKQLP